MYWLRVIGKYSAKVAGYQIPEKPIIDTRGNRYCYQILDAQFLIRDSPPLGLGDELAIKKPAKTNRPWGIPAPLLVPGRG